jgi:WD40 repeat protein
VWEPGAKRRRLAIPANQVRARQMAVTPDGRALRVATTTGVIRWFDARTGEALRQVGDVRPAAGEMAFSPDLRLLAIATTERRQTKVDFGEVTIRDVETGVDLATLHGHTLTVHAMAFNPDGRRLATGSDDRTVRIWDTASGSELLLLGEHPDRVLRAAFRADGRVLVTTSADGSIRLWDATTTPQKRPPPPPKRAVKNAPERGPPPREVK